MLQSASRISRHMLIMVLCCLIPLAALAAILIFKVPLSQTLSFGLILLCPLGHLLMMSLMGGHRHDPEDRAARTIDGESRPVSSKGDAACH